jgi:hypothetical protein
MKTEKLSGAQRTQRAVIDEWWSDERVQSYLDIASPEGENPDYHVLLKAYRGMVPDAFERFVEFFVEAGRDLNAAGPDGRSILQHVEEHQRSGDYARILKDAGAR